LNDLFFVVFFARQIGIANKATQHPPDLAFNPADLDSHTLLSSAIYGWHYVRVF
jgi:hypothetical protein